MEGAQRFFGALGIEFPEGPFAPFAHPWLGEVMGTPAEDGDWTIVYARLPEANGGGAMISLELIEFHALGVERNYQDARLTDANITMITLEVIDLDEMLETATAGGATVYTPNGVTRLGNGDRSVILRAPESHAFLELRRTRPESATAARSILGHRSTRRSF
jgi:hypothetical protein